MGSLFQQGGLTQPGSQLQGADGSTTIGRPDQVLAATQKVLQSRVQPGDIGQQDMSGLPRIGQPSFMQAATAGATPGGVNAMSPGLNKAGKLATLLTSGLQGALAGRAASENAVIQSGGRRSGGAGMGFEAGYELPLQRASKQLGLQQQQAQVEATRAQSQMINTPSGPMPAWLAKAILPASIRAGATTEAAETAAGGRVKAAEIGQRFKAVPGVGLFDTTSRQVVPGTANGVTITPEIAKDYQLPDEFIGKPMNVGQLASLERSMNQQTTTVQGAAGPALVEKAGPQKGQTTQLGLGSPAVAAAQARPVQAALDPNNPGALQYTTAGNAIKTGAAAPGSASVAAAKTAAKSEVPTNVGNQKVAFTTAIQHADLLKSAISALGNGDQQTLNSLKNRFKAEFGVSGPVTAEAISDAYGREVTSILSKGHMTDSEIGTVGKTLNVNRQSPQQSLAVINAYRALAQSKMNMLQQQVNSAKGGNKTTGNEIQWHIENGKLVQGAPPK